jgi:hypothetical protein
LSRRAGVYRFRTGLRRAGNVGGCHTPETTPPRPDWLAGVTGFELAYVEIKKSSLKHREDFQRYNEIWAPETFRARAAGNGLTLRSAFHVTALAARRLNSEKYALRAVISC